jgi:hypothetical protein
VDLHVGAKVWRFLQFYGSPITGSQVSHFRYSRNRFSQQVETLAPDLEPSVRTNASDIAPRSCQAFDNAEADRVGHQSDDRNGGRSCLEVQHEAGRIRYDQIRIPTDYLTGQFGIMLRPSFAGVPLDRDVLSLDITKLA